ncbi:cation-translocating P-type ATPase [Citreimonas salinaria]|uniref:ATPase, P-type (Transporting), HAD superfamily, subfamily IC n=1 Tax=Citreimonas salinaria TaxID=321339 RepID=A0A1H3K9I5_9RHOB|nr:HAD-IC family P-type ATPase [Citreimonas salinaria]SDY48773.1 ATPase, P-type (transporting), HAD superfamily, subfamily IC [Citreimonas salinaria]
MANGGLPKNDDLAERPWHAVPGDEAVDDLGSDRDKGLSDREAERRHDEYGSNKLPERQRETLFQTFLRQFKDPLIYILLAAGLVSLAIGNFEDAAFIFAVLLFNAGLGTYQEYKAESAAQSLQQVMRITAQVTREGEKEEVDSTDLVPGDIVSIKSGASVPADIRLLKSQNLLVDESLLTGESTQVEKRAQAQLDPDTSLGDRTTLLHAGSNVTSGRGTGVVCRTGTMTEIGRIAKSLTEEEQVPPLVLRVRRFTRVIAVGVLVIIVVLGLLQALRGDDLTEIFFLAVALAVSAIPAGLPVAITVAISIGSNRMAKRNVIVRKLPAVEGLGACTLIASDKTGTLTENKLTANRIRPLEGEDVDVSGAGYEPDGDFTRDSEILDPEQEEWLRDIAITGALCNEAEYDVEDGEVRASGDTVDVAFLVLARKLGLSREELLEQHPEVGGIPFESERRFAATFNRHDDRIVAHVKGAAQTLAEMCGVDVETVREREVALAGDGYRVLGAAAGEVDEATAEKADPDALAGLRFQGLVGLIDPVRKEVPGAVDACHDAGVEVRMVTGDHPGTALAIGRQLHIADDEGTVVTGNEIGRREEGGSGTASETIRKAAIYARVEPRQKTTIIDTLQDAGHVVAVTGDGVNDAPALRAAHIGVAMGEGGTDVARNAADLILTDDNFASIVNGIEEGRIAYDNVRKVVWLLISTGVAELVLFTLSVIFNTPLPLTPVQLLWLNLVTNGIQDVALAFEKGEPGVLKRRPRDPDERIFNRLMIEEVLTSGLYMGFVGFGVFWFLTAEMNYETFDARNLLLLLLVLFENVHAFNVRSETRSAFRIPLSANWLLVGAVVVSQGVHIVSMFIPGWSGVLEIQPVAFTTWAILLTITLSKFLIVEAYKAFRGRALAERIYQKPARARKAGDGGEGDQGQTVDHARSADFAKRAEFAKSAEYAEKIVRPEDRKEEEEGQDQEDKRKKVTAEKKSQDRDFEPEEENEKAEEWGEEGGDAGEKDEDEGPEGKRRSRASGRVDEGANGPDEEKE